MCALILMKHLWYLITWKGHKDKQIKCSHHYQGETPTGKARFCSSLKIRQCRNTDKASALQVQKEKDTPSICKHRAEPWRALVLGWYTRSDMKFTHLHFCDSAQKAWRKRLWCCCGRSRRLSELRWEDRFGGHQTPSSLKHYLATVSISLCLSILLF